MGATSNSTSKAMKQRRPLKMVAEGGRIVTESRQKHAWPASADALSAFHIFRTSLATFEGHLKEGRTPVEDGRK